MLRSSAGSAKSRRSGSGFIDVGPNSSLERSTRAAPDLIDSIRVTIGTAYPCLSTRQPQLAQKGRVGDGICPRRFGVRLDHSGTVGGFIGGLFGARGGQACGLCASEASDLGKADHGDSAQMRAARAYLDWTIDQAAAASGLNRRTIIRLEHEEHYAEAQYPSLATLVAAYRQQQII